MLFACVCVGGGGGVRKGAFRFVPDRGGLFHTILLREKWSLQLTWKLCCALRDQRCYQHHDHKQALHLAPHYNYGRGISTVENRLTQLCQEQVVARIRMLYNLH